ncbi:hypothetical protein NDU88_006626 [Pleurodeles waltl]|uniref:Uncharacterized protein n=1 Tax=Pleurodeles waltl TaxID=8319 RepID=A0AAV7U003_PLEWA|nr:hypothetical protein NDU88_006626 [Pleurodeles waltl]
MWARKGAHVTLEENWNTRGLVPPGVVPPGPKALPSVPAASPLTRRLLVLLFCCRLSKPTTTLTSLGGHAPQAPPYSRAVSAAPDNHSARPRAGRTSCSLAPGASSRCISRARSSPQNPVRLTAHQEAAGSFLNFGLVEPPTVPSLLGQRSAATATVPGRPAPPQHFLGASKGRPQPRAGSQLYSVLQLLAATQDTAPLGAPAVSPHTQGPRVLFLSPGPVGPSTALTFPGATLHSSSRGSLTVGTAPSTLSACPAVGSSPVRARASTLVPGFGRGTGRQLFSPSARLRPA